MVEKLFGGITPYQDGRDDPAPRPQARLNQRSKRELEQVHLCIGVPIHPITHPQRFAVSVLNTILGGGMSSRLFQNVREREGLAYAIFSDVNSYRDTGCLSVYAGTAPETARQTLRLILAELARMKNEPVAPEELRRAQDNLKGNLMLSLESTASRMTKLARDEMYFGRSFSPDELLAAVDAVTTEDVQGVAREFFQPQLLGATLLGPLDGLEITRDELAC